jgi:uncharacterized membrane protein
MATAPANASRNSKAAEHPFRQAVLRGLAVISPPLFTVLIFVWVISTTNLYVLEPMTGWLHDGLVWSLKDIREDLPVQGPQRRVKYGDKTFYRLDNGEFVPANVVAVVQAGLNDKAAQKTSKMTGKEIYAKYVDLRFHLPYSAIPFFLALFLLLLYLVGKFMAAGIGRFFVHRFERGVHRLPLVRNVYSSVKQVSDFLFSQPDMEYTRVVAVEYPRKGIWSLGFVTSEGMLDIRAAANEPILSVLMPTSPMPVTGFTVTVRKSETIDLNITIDQAFQFIISCGVVVPAQQLQQMRAPAEALPAPADAPQPAARGQEVVDSG